MINKINQEIKEIILILDNNGTQVTGLNDSDFTKSLLKDGSNASESISISEKGDGMYYISFTPESTGYYEWKVSHSTYEPNGWYEYYTIVNYDTDDISSSLTDIGLNLQRTLGLTQENSYIDNTTYDVNGNLLTARIRIYTGSEYVGTTSEIIATYNSTSTYNASSQLLTYQVLKE